jgi:hypothetical protein
MKYTWSRKTTLPREYCVVIYISLNFGYKNRFIIFTCYGAWLGGDSRIRSGGSFRLDSWAVNKRSNIALTEAHIHG